MNLGRLKKVALRDVWETEDQHFTPWLRREENILRQTFVAEYENEKAKLEAILATIQEVGISPFEPPEPLAHTTQ